SILRRRRNNSRRSVRRRPVGERVGRRGDRRGGRCAGANASRVGPQLGSLRPAGSARSPRVTSPAFLSPPPKVTLTNGFTEPYDNAVATARTCYNSRIITAEDVRRDDRARALRDRIAR